VQPSLLCHPPGAMKRIFLAPYPRSLTEIFNSLDLERLRTLGDLVIHEEAEVAEDVFETQVATADVIIGQIDLPESRLKRIPSLRAIINVEGNFLPNVDFGIVSVAVSVSSPSAPSSPSR
jgi:hypothetical protein